MDGMLKKFAALAGVTFLLALALACAAGGGDDDDDDEGDDFAFRPALAATATR